MSEENKITQKECKEYYPITSLKEEYNQMILLAASKGNIIPYSILDKLDNGITHYIIKAYNRQGEYKNYIYPDIRKQEKIGIYKNPVGRPRKVI
jgi:hypothetical protein